jgi:hypothetical protein
MESEARDAMHRLRWCPICNEMVENPVEPTRKYLVFGVGTKGPLAMHEDCAKKVAHPDYNWGEDATG